MTASAVRATTEMKGSASSASTIMHARMYKRSIKPIADFLMTPPPHGVYIIDTQFGKINYVSGEVAPVISTRVNANAAYYVIEI